MTVVLFQDGREGDHVKCLRGVRISIVAIVFGLLVACGKDSPTGPSNLFEGTWVGVIADDDGGTGQLRMEIAEVGPGGVTGTFSTTFPNPQLNAEGNVSGTTSGTNGVLYLAAKAPLVCSVGVLANTIGITAKIDGDHLTGTFAGFACEGGVRAGTVDVTRQ